MTTSHLSQLEAQPEDSILGIANLHNKDPNPQKIDLSIGAYRDDNGKPYIFKTVRQAELEMLDDPECNKEYLPIDGLPKLLALSKKLLFEDTEAYQENRICTVQALSGTGALKLCGEFVKFAIPNIKTTYVSSPTWDPYQGIFESSDLEIKEYPYYNWEKKCIDIDGMCKALSQIDENNLVILHTCAHNPTGLDLSKDEWMKVIEIIKKQKFLVMMDTAYPGFASGDVLNDIWAFRQMANMGLEFFVAQSYAKNFGLYGERIGMMHLICKDSETAQLVGNNLRYIARQFYGTPPCHGAYIVQNILSDPDKIETWKSELEHAAKRLEKVRKNIIQGLKKRGTPGDWSHIEGQKGMFCLTGLTPNQSQKMTNTYHIYMLSNGRISVGGLNAHNIDYFLDSFDETVRSVTY